MRAAITTSAWLLALIVGLGGTAWYTSDYFRRSWLPRQDTTVQAVAGTASSNGLTVTLTDVADLGPTPAFGKNEKWQPPAGFHAWRVAVETTTTVKIASCDIDLVDERGRRFRAGSFVGFITGYSTSYFCNDDPERKEKYKNQAMLVLVPEDANITHVFVMNSSTHVIMKFER